MRYDTINMEKSNDTAKKILNAAYTLYIEKGFSSVTNRDVAAYAGVNLGLITYYFASKEKLGAEVMRLVNDKTYRKASLLIDSELSCAEKLYIQTILIWKLFNPQEYSFIKDFTRKHSIYTVSDAFHQLSLDVIEYYNLNISTAENNLYFTALKGAELALFLKYNRKELDITTENIVDTIISNYFFNIGLPNEEITSIIANSKKILDKILLKINIDSDLNN